MLVASGISFSLFLICLWAVISGRTKEFDQIATARAVSLRSPWLNGFMRFFTEMGRPIGGSSVFVLLMFVADPWYAIAYPAALSMLVAWLIAFIIKRIVKRPRPIGQRMVEETDHSFPSFHATCSAAIYLTIGLLGSYLFPDFAIPLGLLAFFMGLMIGLSRVYLGIHYLSDVIGGWFFGSSVSLLVIYLFTIIS